MSSREAIDILHKERPRNRFTEYSWAFFAGLLLASWPIGQFSYGELLSERKLANAKRFLSEALPYPIQEGKGFSEAISWAINLFWEKGFTAVAATLAISILAIVLTGLFSSLVSPFAARTVATSDPYLYVNGRNSCKLCLFFLVIFRAAFIFLRAVPEYIWAYLFLSLLGPSAWPAIFALALHNTGILGKLSSDAIEDLERAPLSALSALGANRTQLTIAGIFPAVLNKFLVYFFYRWETCVRESTVLGLLGVVSLGLWIQDGRARNFYDEMMFFVLLGALLVMLGDVVSDLARKSIRDA